MKYYLVKSVAETNPILWDGVTPYTPPQGWQLLNEAQFVEWRKNNPEPLPPPPPVPDSVGPAQLRIALWRSHGIKPNDVLALIAAIPDPQAEAEAEILWEYSAEVRRSHPLVTSFGAAFSLTKEQIDDVFRLAKTL